MKVAPDSSLWLLRIRVPPNQTMSTITKVPRSSLRGWASSRRHISLFMMLRYPLSSPSNLLSILSSALNALMIRSPLRVSSMMVNSSPILSWPSRDTFFRDLPM